MPASKYDLAMIGGSGFVAGHLLNDLRETSQRILILSRTRPESLSPGMTWRSLDLSKPEQIQRLSDTPIEVQTCLFNSVRKGRYATGSPEWADQGLVTAPDFTQLFQRLNLHPRRLLTIGSSEEYGARITAEPISENSEANPLSSYGYWKKMLMARAEQWSLGTNQTFLHLRPFVVYGVGQDRSMFLDSLLDCLFRGETFQMTYGAQWRSWLHVETLSKIIVLSLQEKVWRHSVLNVSDVIYLQLSEVARRVQQMVDQGRVSLGAVPYRDGEVWHQKPSLDRLDEMFPDRPKRDFFFDVMTLIHRERALRGHEPRLQL